ncbi:unnamed protein product [Urochloa decumbens]|uniref:mitogen-activated protein kinase kinase kinase n=1 Tax=Urochloa decumbens TaxID=240449 RepID=A0ABC9E977_9POAL
MEDKHTLALTCCITTKTKIVAGESSGDHDQEKILNDQREKPCNLPLHYLEEITNQFSEERELGRGAFGVVYRGVLCNGQVVAVKKLMLLPGMNAKHFEIEVYHLTRLKHENIIRIVGYCYEIQHILIEHNGKCCFAEVAQRLLCLEYMPKGSLRGYLSDEASGLGWETRYKIIEGICYGLHHLHDEWQPGAPIIHMDLKPANILLDNNMVPKIADFGLSRLFSEEKTWTCTINRDGTLGYMAPEYITRGVVSTKSDIFSLGVIIIEIVTGHRDYPDGTGISPQEFSELVLKNWRNRLEKTMGYTELSYQQIKRCIQIGLVCVEFDRSKRPPTSQIIKMLHPESSSRKKRAAGGGGINGVGPQPLLKPPPSMVLPVARWAGSTWDILRSFAPDEEQHFPGHQDAVKEDEENSLLSTKKDDGTSSTTNESMFYISQNKMVRKKMIKIRPWNRGVLLGSGSFGTVYEGISNDGVFFAVKEVNLFDQGSNAQQCVFQLEQEIALLSQFEHENIVQYYGTDVEDSKLYILLELVTQGSLASLYQKYRLRDTHVSAYTRQILNGLTYLHERNIVHRDIKCANILVHANGSVKLADFGLAKEINKFSVFKSCKGTVYWMAPEVVNPKKTYGTAADIWSLGCTILEMLTRQIPYPDMEWTQALYTIGRGEAPAIPSNLSKDARDFISQCAKPNPEDRPSASKLLEHPFLNRSIRSARSTSGIN